MKKVLILSSRIPYPLIGGDRIRIYNYGKILKQRYQVDLAYINDYGTQHYKINLYEAFDNLIEFNFPSKLLVLNSIPALFTRKPVQVLGNYFSKIQRWLNEHLQKYDYLICSHIRMAEYIARLPQGIAPKTFKILEYHDAISLNYEQARFMASGFWKYWYYLEYPRVKGYESDVLDYFDVGFVCSPLDRQYILENRQRTGKPFKGLFLMPMAVDAGILRIASPVKEENWIVFLGKMDYYPNELAVEYFVREIFPGLLARDRTVKFYIIGANPTNRVKRLTNIPNVIVTGYVADPFDYVRRAKVFVSPQLIGAGMQTKVINAMALGKPVVGTTKALGAIEGENGVHFLVADDRQTFINALDLLLNSTQFRQAVGQRARELVERLYTWDRVGERLLEVFEKC
uniref:Glycosyltransferase n=1 Tax=candidate division CPR3 bacterium TaxID=2268181 RepID=A0A7V3J946_UNCC3